MSHHIKLIVGLGNPGSQYENTRHNAGAWVIHTLSQIHAVSLKKETKFAAQVGAWNSENAPCYLAIPTTFMNLSGQAVYALSHFYRLKPSEILIIHDELDLSPGIAKLKFSGGHGGHNGLKDIIAHLQSHDFYRLRIGIGHPGHRDDVSDYVLHRPSLSEKQQIESAIENSLSIFSSLLAGEMEKAMRLLHSQT